MEDDGDRVVRVCIRCGNLDGDIWCSECPGNWCHACYFLDPHREEEYTMEPTSGIPYWRGERR